jgi:lipid-binding SYLF domain-containing protein
VDGKVISQKPELNADFYSSEITSEQILRDEVVPQDGALMWPAGPTQLIELLKLIDVNPADGAVRN